MLDADTSPETHAIIGAAFEVHSLLGPGLLEAAYQEALSLEFCERSIPHQREFQVPIHYKRWKLSTSYRADFLAHGTILLELKALASIGRLEEAQLIHYLSATGLPFGLLLNFGSTSLQVRRLTNPRPKPIPEIPGIPARAS
jgi:GxxExxY protein